VSAVANASSAAMTGDVLFLGDTVAGRIPLTTANTRALVDSMQVK